MWKGELILGAVWGIGNSVRRPINSRFLQSCSKLIANSFFMFSHMLDVIELRNRAEFIPA
jgi:hypothetical protein